jgi:hypothetical protein
MTHGTRSGYNSGCRCPECTEANTAASRARRERLAGRSMTTRMERPARRPAPQAPGLIPQRPSAPSPRPERAPATPSAAIFPNLLGTWARRPLVQRRAEDTRLTRREVEEANWDEYARRLRHYLAGDGPSPNL